MSRSHSTTRRVAHPATTSKEGTAATPAQPLPVVVNILPILYDGLPEPERFRWFCRAVADRVNENPLLQHYKVTTRVADELLPLLPALCGAAIPPRSRRYNVNDGWHTTPGHIRFRLDQLYTRDRVDDVTDLTFPGLERNNIVLALIPASIETTPELSAQDKHFNSGAAWSGRYRTKAMVLVYHVLLRDDAGNIVEDAFREWTPENVANDIIHNIAETIGIDDPQMEWIRIEFGYETGIDPERPDVDDRLRALYFGRSFADLGTLKRALLLFDDLHFHDRPSLAVGQWGLVGSASAARQYAYSFASEGVPVLVHGTPDVIKETALDAIAREIEDPEFSRIVWEGLRDDPSFRNYHLPPEADYRYAKGAEIAGAMIRADLGGKPYDLRASETPPERIYDPADLKGIAHAFLQILVSASMELNLCCGLAHENDLLPFTDFATYNRLLIRRHERGIERAQLDSRKLALPRLSFSILDQVIPRKLIESASLGEIIDLRKANRESYAAFRSHLLRLHAKLDVEDLTEDADREIAKVLREDVIPLAEEFQRETKRLGEELLGELYKKATAGFGGMGAIDVALRALGGLTWAEILLQGCGVVAGSVLPPLRDHFQEKRNLKRRNALAYLMEARSSLS
jgi:hypothetical protein